MKWVQHPECGFTENEHCFYFHARCAKRNEAFDANESAA